MRKNIERVIEAFRQKRPANDKSCHTNGDTIYSYNMPIAWRDAEGKVVVVDYDKAPTATTRSQVSACMSAFGIQHKKKGG